MRAVQEIPVAGNTMADCVQFQALSSLDGEPARNCTVPTRARRRSPHEPFRDREPTERGVYGTDGSGITEDNRWEDADSCWLQEMSDARLFPVQPNLSDWQQILRGQSREFRRIVT